MHSYAREIAVARELALQAGALILRYRGTGVDVDKKAGDEPVTRADREASELIVAGLAQAFPKDIIISEEAADDPRRLEPGNRVWFIDPLDGTKDFIRNLPGFAVMIGLCVGTRPRAGVVYQPVGERLFWAAEGQGAWLLGDGGEGQYGEDRRLHCSTLADVAKVRLVASASHRTGKIDQVKSALGIADELQIGSVGLKLGLIALDERDLYVNPSSKSKAWDTAAPEIILHEAGGRLSDLWGQPLRYDDPDMWNRRGLLASNGVVHDDVLARLAPLFPEPSAVE
jgi:3'(2'), 5'-bisphosphate nucleotidase